MRKKICVVTGSRAEYGLLQSTLKEIKASKHLELLLVVTGMHLSPEFGNTVDEITKDGFEIADRVEMLVSSDTSVGTAKSIGLGVTGFADSFRRLRPDIVLLLGDRYEIFAAVTAAMAMNIPVAHISGGDITEGVIDNEMRHAITKMAHVHFVAMDMHARRLAQMGEEKWRVHVVGEPCIDGIKGLKRMPKTELEKTLGTKLGSPTVLVTFHPVTLRPGETTATIKNLLGALGKIDAKIIFTYPNADAGGRGIISEIASFRKEHPGAVAFKSLGSHVYLNLLANADLIVGNSSSAIVEAPSFYLPAVNIGDRQKGRVIPRNVVSASGDESSIRKAINKALSPDFRKKISGMKNPYGNGGAAKKIVSVLTGLKTGSMLLSKKFVEI